MNVFEGQITFLSYIRNTEAKRSIYSYEAFTVITCQHLKKKEFANSFKDKCIPRNYQIPFEGLSCEWNVCKEKANL